MWVFLNDRFISEKEAKISVFDQGFLYGDGIFETVRIRGGHPKFFAEHCARLRESCRLIHLKLPEPEPDWQHLTQQLIERNSLSEATVRITITRGPSGGGIASPIWSAPTIVIFGRPLFELAPHHQNQGVRLVTTEVRRQPRESLPPQIKSLNYLPNILAKREAIQKHAFDGLMLNTDNHIAEATTSNVFFVRGTQVYTPSVDCGIVPGITRSCILRLARAKGILIQEGRYKREEIVQATECFLTNSGFDVLPVQAIDTHELGPYGPHSLTREFQQWYLEHLNMPEPSLPA